MRAFLAKGKKVSIEFQESNKMMKDRQLEP